MSGGTSAILRTFSGIHPLMDDADLVVRGLCWKRRGHLEALASVSLGLLEERSTFYFSDCLLVQVTSMRL